MLRYRVTGGRDVPAHDERLEIDGRAFRLWRSSGAPVAGQFAGDAGRIGGGAARSGARGHRPASTRRPPWRHRALRRETIETADGRRIDLGYLAPVARPVVALLEPHFAACWTVSPTVRSRPRRARGGRRRDASAGSSTVAASRSRWTCRSCGSPCCAWQGYYEPAGTWERGPLATCRAAATVGPGWDADLPFDARPSDRRRLQPCRWRSTSRSGRRRVASSRCRAGARDRAPGGEPVRRLIAPAPSATGVARAGRRSGHAARARVRRAARARGRGGRRPRRRAGRGSRRGEAPAGLRGLVVLRRQQDLGRFLGHLATGHVDAAVEQGHRVRALPGGRRRGPRSSPTGPRARRSPAVAARPRRRHRSTSGCPDDRWDPPARRPAGARRRRNRAPATEGGGRCPTSRPCATASRATGSGSARRPSRGSPRAPRRRASRP